MELFNIFNVKMEQLIGASRIMEVADGRKVYCYVQYELCGKSHTEIAKKLNRERTTVSYLIKGCEDLMKTDKKFRAKVELLMSRLEFAAV